MLKRNHPLLKLKLKNEKLFFTKIKDNFYEPLYSLFILILEDPFENIWFESFSIIIGYLQLLFYIFDETVRKNKNIFIF